MLKSEQELPEKPHCASCQRRKAFIPGFSTAISCGIVSVGERYGSMFELVGSDTISEFIARTPGQVENYGRMMAQLGLRFAIESVTGGIIMKITTFDPVIDTAKPDDLIGLFEELGFTTTHTPLKDGVIRLYRMKHDEGFHVEVAADPNLQQDRTCIRINVDDLEEAAAILTAHGFQPRIIHSNNPTAKGMHMISPAGLMIILIQHIKNQ